MQAFRSFVGSQPFDVPFVFAYKGKYIVQVEKSTVGSHHVNAYYYVDNSQNLVDHDFEAGVPAAGQLTIEKTTHVTPGSTAAFATELRGFLEALGLANISLLGGRAFNWYDAIAAYYMTPFAAVDDEGNDVTIVAETKSMYDGANDAYVSMFVGSDGTKYAARAFDNNVQSYLGINDENQWDIFEPEEQTILDLPYIVAWEYYPNDIMSAGLVSYIRERISEQKLYQNAWGFGDGEGALCVVNSARDALAIRINTENGVKECHNLLNTDFTPNRGTLNGPALSCPIDVSSVLNFASTEEPQNVSFERVSCNAAENDGVVRFHALEGEFPDFNLSYRYDPDSQEHVWRIGFVELA